MSVVSIRFNDEEEKVIKKFIESKGFSVSQYIKDLIFEKIEDEYDIKVGEEAYKEYVDSGKKSRPFSELKKELGLKD